MSPDLLNHKLSGRGPWELLHFKTTGGSDRAVLHSYRSASPNLPTAYNWKRTTLNKGGIIYGPASTLKTGSAFSALS